MKTIKPLNSDRLILVDDEDFEALSKHNWWLSKSCNAYAFRYCSETRKSVYMTRELLKVTDKNLNVDHLDFNTVNNQRSNLRIITRQENNQYCRKTIFKRSSKYKGVNLTKGRKASKYRVRIMLNSKSIHIGYFETEIEAAKAYNEAALKHFKTPYLNVL